MSALEVDVAVLGSGFAGSLAALLLSRIGRSTVLIDPATHPRFAIGESSTPTANLVLRDLANRYDLPRLLPLSQYGPWQEHYPELVCGRKRGFSYFQHTPQQPFQPRGDHANELLVAASANDYVSDTHWFRADVDQFLVEEVRQSGTPVLEGTRIEQIQPWGRSGWELVGPPSPSTVRIRARLVVDASGAAAVMPRAVGAEPRHHDCRTRSRGLYGHFRQVGSWHTRFQEWGGRVADHPFHCDDAAQHHVLDGGWLWMLRFREGTTSVGFMLDTDRHPVPSSLSAEQEWAHWLGEYPGLARLLEDACLVNPPTGLVRTSRLQRWWPTCTGSHWVALPNTAGFIDPLHSTGIAQSLCGLERLLEIVERAWDRPHLAEALQHYQSLVNREFELIDLLVAGGYATLREFAHFTAFAMLYFAAATHYEARRVAGDRPAAFLCADDPRWMQIVRESYAAIQQPPADFPAWVATKLAPYNRVGLFTPAVPNMYHHTAAPL